jgi:hypothetical protein
LFDYAAEPCLEAMIEIYGPASIGVNYELSPEEVNSICGSILKLSSAATERTETDPQNLAK